MWEEAPGKVLWVGVVTHPTGGCAHRGVALPPLPRSPAPLPSLEPLNSFSVRPSKPPPSYLGVRETEAGAEESGLGSHPGQALLGSIGVNPANVIPFLSPLYFVHCLWASPAPAWLIPPESCCLWDEIRECTLHAQVYNHLSTLDPKRAGATGREDMEPRSGVGAGGARKP